MHRLLGSGALPTVGSTWANTGSQRVWGWECPLVDSRVNDTVRGDAETNFINCNISVGCACLCHSVLNNRGISIMDLRSFFSGPSLPSALNTL